MEHRILVLAPDGRDADVTLAVLRQAGIAGTACPSVADLVGELSRGAVAAIVAEEALTGTNPAPLLDWIESQPAWSDFPFIVLTKPGPPRLRAAAGVLDRLGDTVRLQRPLSAETLASAARSAVRSRYRQYEVRALTLGLEERVAQAIAQREQAEGQLRQAQKMEAIGQLTGGVAHDFNNFLAVIIGNLDLLLRPRTNRQNTRRLAVSALAAAEHCAELVSGLLAFSRQQTLRLVTVDPNALVADCAILIHRATGAAIAVELSLDAEVQWCRTDAAQLQAAVLNLAINARDAMPEGGALTITTRNVVLAASDLVGNLEASPGPFVALAVRDTGTGMSADVLTRAFEPFYTTKEVGKGTGLGLSQVYGFVHQSSGHVVIETGESGTTVTLYLPATDRPQEPVREASVPAPRAAASDLSTVLVVEDDERVLDMACETLSSAGYRVLPARDGRQALTLLRKDKSIELVFSDVVMPNGLSGIELGRQTLALRPDVKVLLTSGYAGAALDGVVASGEFEVVGKPYRPKHLVARIAAALGGETAPAAMAGIES